MELLDVLRRWPGATRPSWQEVVLQLWFDPGPELVEHAGEAGRSFDGVR